MKKYTNKRKERKKKQKISKKIGRKHKNENRHIFDTNISGGADTLDTSVKKKTEVEKKKTVEWTKPRRQPTPKEQRTLFGKALEIMLITCMDNHVYQFENKVRIQKQGGPIGLKLTGEIADCLMIDWDKKLLSELKKYRMIPEVFTRFKDDIEIAIESLEKGIKLVENEIIIDENKKLVDENKSDSKVTMEVIQEIANSINPMIKLTVETPCNFEDGKLPVLDVKVNVNEKENNRIDFEFFEKPTKNSRVILATSALSFSKKRTILTQECLRRLRNTKIELGPEIQRRHLSQFMLKLKNSGYNEKFRLEILDSGLKAFNKMVENDKNGIKPMYRNRNWNSEERQKSKSKKKFSWWNNEKSKIQYTSVLFVTPTPGGVLAKELRKREEELNKNDKERIKIEEKGGLKMKDILCSKNPFQKTKCLQKTCPLCTESEFVEITTEEVKIPCNTNNIGYRWLCLTCKERNVVKVYEGETGRSARTRGAEHLKELEKKKEKSVLFKHKMTDHKQENVKFQMEITNKFKDALTRQANEAVRIYSRPALESLNSKSEFNHPPHARVVVERKEKR